MTDDEARWCRLLAWREEMRSLNVANPRGEIIDGADVLWLIDQLVKHDQPPPNLSTAPHLC